MDNPDPQQQPTSEPAAVPQAAPEPPAQPPATIQPARLAETPKAEPPASPATAPPAEPKRNEAEGGRPFDPELLQRTLQRYPEAREWLKQFLGVDQMQKTMLEMSIREARLIAVADLGFTKEQAAQIPGTTAEEIIRNAQFASQHRAAGAGAPSPPATPSPANAGQPPQQPAAPQPAPPGGAQVPRQFISQPSGEMDADAALEAYKQLTAQR